LTYYNLVPEQPRQSLSQLCYTAYYGKINSIASVRSKTDTC